MASKEEIHNDVPSPADFAAYLPWACNQLQVPTEVQVVKMQLNEYAISLPTHPGKSPKSKSKVKMTSPTSDDLYQDDIKPTIDENVIKIIGIYDDNDDLVNIKINENKMIPRTVWFIIRLILKFQPYLQMVTISRGLDKYGLHELNKSLPHTHITELCLDGCWLPESCYYVFLEQKNYLRQLSLSRCSINDATVEKIALNLVYPSPASLTLRVLNLSSNKITDAGAIYLANCLRSNRHLAYLNLAGNMIEDGGASALLNTLLEFPVSEEEVKEARARKMKYLKNKKEVLNNILQNLRSEDEDKRFRKRTLKTAPIVKKGKIEGDASRIIEQAKVPEPLMYERAMVLAENMLGTFFDPFLPPNSVSRNGKLYCLGNYTLSYLNLAYNNLSYLSLKLFLNILVYQKLLGRKPMGLINFNVEGNNLPVTCKEMLQIDDMLDKGLMTFSRRCSISSKKNKQFPPKTPTRTPI